MKLVGSDIAKLEMDQASFRILLADGTIVRSQNVLDVRQPDLPQVGFWSAAGHYDDEPAPDQIKRDPAFVAPLPSLLDRRLAGRSRRLPRDIHPFGPPRETPTLAGRSTRSPIT